MGVRLKRLREERRLTQQALADAIGISLSYLNQIENNQRPLTVAVLLKLNAAFGVDVQLFSGEDEARLVGELREALFDPGVGEEISSAELKEIATGMPAVGRAIVGLHKRLSRALDQSAALPRGWAMTGRATAGRTQHPSRPLPSRRCATSSIQGTIISMRLTGPPRQLPRGLACRRGAW